MNNGYTEKLLTTPDVLVIGGGSAGVAAAVGAAQQGAAVTLIEKNSFAGGKATAAYVGTVCGLYYRSENPVSQFVHQGFPMEFALELADRSKSSPVHYKNGLHFLPYDQFQFALLCDEWLKKSAQSVYFHANLNHAIQENNSITSVNVLAGNRQVTFNPKTVIDASGEDLLATLLGISSLQSDQYQAAAQVFQLSNIVEEDASLLSLAMIRTIQKGIASGKLDPHFERVSLVPGSLRNGYVLIKVPLPVPVNNAFQYRTQLEFYSRNAVNELVSFLKTNGIPFKNCNLTFIAPEAGVRTGPRHEGKYILTGNDVLSMCNQVDAVARGAWPVEYWETGQNVRMEYFDLENYYDIPSGSLQSKTVSNLFFAGRNISADDKAIASARVIGTCLATGYAAGTLAAFQSMNKSQSDAVATVQQRLSITPVNA